MPSYRSSEPTIRPDYVEPGDYTVEVINASESISQKSRNELIELKLKVEPSGAIIYDNLVFTPNAFWKIDAFRAAIGEIVLPDEEVEIHADEFIGKRGLARLTIEEFQGRKRNRVAAWLVPQAKPAAPAAKPSGGEDDSIPF